jgi:hypothetical protein
MLVQLHFPRRLGGCDPSLKAAADDLAMEVFLSRSGRLTYKFCPKATRAIGALIARQNMSEKEAQRVFVDSFEELERLSTEYLELPSKDTPKASAIMRRTDELRIICGAA